MSLLAVAGLALGLAACSSSPHAITTTTTSPTATSTVPPTTSSVAGPAPCSTAVLEVTSSPGGASAGSSSEIFALTNAGPGPCWLEGYPKVAFYGPSGAAGQGAGPLLDIATVDGGPAPARVMLASKGAAEFLVRITDVPVNGTGCEGVASVEITPPGSSESLANPVSLEPCGGSVTVYPIAPPGAESA